ncbi:MAG TPA: glycoside hydrolase family 9 protein [Gemmatimonadaceae bacterium]|nr:glycoside hydrolase family 9 protein [Gemmatimonadaceae bacterium]
MHLLRFLGAAAVVSLLLGAALLPAQQRPAAPARPAPSGPAFRLTTRDYFRRGPVDVMAFQDFYPDGHQGGVSVIQHGVRVASNGDLRLEPTPGQWSPMPQQDRREVRRADNEVVTWLSYPDTSKNRHGFNPIVYPALELRYAVRVRGEGDAVRVTVDLDRPLPAEWVGRVGFNLELYPADLFGKSWSLGGTSGLFPRQAMGPETRAPWGELQPVPLASGTRLTIAPETELQRLTIESRSGELHLYDGRNQHYNGWFIVRSLVLGGATKNAIDWVVRPHGVAGWKAAPVVQLSQVGYHPRQKKVAVVELDAADDGRGVMHLERVRDAGGLEVVLSKEPAAWKGEFLRYSYRHFDFSAVTRPGTYVIRYRSARTHPFRIADDVYARGVWQPTLEYFLPAQMCHMRVEENYRVWHGLDHLDDARMAFTDSNHFDGYVQGPSTLTRFRGGEPVPGLDRGGWHDAGDYDLRIESQADEVYVLASMYELFGIEWDDTRIDQAQRLAQIHVPDGKPDLLQQTEHGLLSILGGYRSLGRLYRGIQDADLKQYVLLGDIVNNTDNRVDPAVTRGADDRMVFTEQNPSHEYKGIAALAIAGRVLRRYDPALARESEAAAEALWRQPRDAAQGLDDRVVAAAELLLTTNRPEYRDALVALRPRIVERVGQVGWAVGRALPLIGDPAFERAVREAVARDFAAVQAAQRKNPYGVPYEPYIWGAGWGIQEFGVRQYYLHRAFPDVVSDEYMLNALNFVLGVHPGTNTASFASGVGARSMTTAYGTNRADWSYIPGGVVSGTALIRPDFPELKDFPFLWQQGEYVLGGGATNYMFLVLAAQQVLSGK